MLFVIKILLIPELKKSGRLGHEPTVVIEYKKGNKNLYLKINIQSPNEDLGKASLEIYLDNKLIENNMIYIDKINYTLYTSLEYRDEVLLSVILVNKRGNQFYFGKQLNFGG
ncbi:hypothetical protein [Borrelia sp. P9F1]|uniref:hypothetical protein n=1 Tax=Borrelia sp. P9F1 TaxID=3058374 RepID=UPI002649D2A7|nr:hypothetical protein [Borrelia sp. P9F1]WKC57733.1 hypothetical protein QYZ68_00765 [Borrelia sp. P9F1]